MGADPAAPAKALRPGRTPPAPLATRPGYICHDIVQTLAGSIALDNRVVAGRVVGLDAVVRLPLDTPA